MKKQITAAFAALCLISLSGTVMAAGTEEGTQYEEKLTPVIREGKEDGELALRFYEETPNVPYLGLNAYSEYMKAQSLTLRENEDGTVTMENWCGAQLQCDPAAGIIYVEDWCRFFDLPLPLEHEALGWKDTATSFVRISNVEFEDAAQPVTLDFAKYGIQMYVDKDDIFLPVSTLSNMMTDIATNHMLYNGECLYAQKVSLSGQPLAGFMDSEFLQDLLNGAGRPDDLVKQCYADLCFNLDYFFGHPGICMLDSALAEKGLDQALTDLGEKGESIRKRLLSEKVSDYLSGMNELFTIYLSDGHTSFTGGAEALAAGNEEDIGKTGLDYIGDIVQSPSMLKQILHMLIEPQRGAQWGYNTYLESGSTAIIRLDGFMPDEKAWADYYSGTGAFPQDCLGIVLTGLQKASENPEIENVIFDLSCNSGGSPDVMMAILAVTTGQNQLYGIQRLTGQRMILTFDADTNFDGVYDEKDQELKYDFHYGVLVTRHAFSCGNLFPIIIQEAGAALIGEPSSGGSCCIQVGSDAMGFTYLMSSCQWQLTDDAFASVEGGCRIDLPIAPESDLLVDALVSLAGVEEGIPSFQDYFDTEKLDGMMKEYFEEAAADLAA